MTPSSPRLLVEKTGRIRRPLAGSLAGFIERLAQGLTVASSAASCLLGSLSAAAGAQGRVIDDGSFSITRAGGASATESFRITRIDNGQLQATGQLTSGTRRETSRVITDSLGTPLEYQVVSYDGTSRAPTTEIRAFARAGRLSALARNRRGEESMHEYPLVPGRCLVLDDELVHLFYFAAIARHEGVLEVINPRGAREGSFTLAAHGLEPVAINGKTVTGTHYSLSNGAVTRDFWVDASG
ncbi:MAG: hypothetical protein ACHQWU_11245, partial [Gemmatimonadales bacterium]